MVRNIYIFCLISAILLGCKHNDESSFAKEVSESVFTASTEEFLPNTKTILGSNLASVWCEDDMISVFAGNSDMDKYQLDAEGAGYSSGNFIIIEEGNGKGEDLPCNISIYPYYDGLTCSANNSIGNSWRIDGFSFPIEQFFVESSFADDSYAMAAVTSSINDYNLKFKNIGGTLKLQLKGTDKISKLSLTGNNDEKISGKASLYVYGNGGVPVIEMLQESNSTVVIDCGEGIQLSNDIVTDFYFSIPPTVFEKGFTVELESVDGGKGVLKTDEYNEVGRSQILVMPIRSIEIIPSQLKNNYVDEYGVNRGPGVLIDGVIWAPVNCGFKGPSGGDLGFPYGKMYQWGRNSGVGYSIAYDSNTGEMISGGTITIAEANAGDKSNKFYTRKDGNPASVWFSDASFESVWNAGSASEPLKAAYDPCPEGWRIPTQNEMKSLTTNKSAFSVENSLNGYWFSGSVPYGKDVPSVFFPAAGSLDYKGIGSMRTSFGRYWTSSVDGKNIYYLSFMNNGTSYVTNSTGAVSGYAVRCVSDSRYSGNPDDNIIEIEAISLNVSSLDIIEGASYKFTVSVYPKNASTEFMTWISSNENVCIVNNNGEVTAISAGNAIVTVSIGNFSAQCSINVTKKDDSGSGDDEGEGDSGDDDVSVLIDYIDEYGINHGHGICVDGVIWSPVNCGYLEAGTGNKGYPYGKLYQWGRISGVGYSSDYDETVAQKVSGGSITVAEANIPKNSNIFYTMSNGNNMSIWFTDATFEGVWNAGSVAEPMKSEYDPCPEGWRIPTKDEMYSLVKNCSEFTSFENKNGYWFSGSVGYAVGVEAVFLPAGGYLDHTGSRRNRGSLGRYWTSSLYNTSSIYHLSYANSHTSVALTGTVFGCNIRCVQE